jgi:hypothetical protein
MLIKYHIPTRRLVSKKVTLRSREIPPPLAVSPSSSLPSYLPTFTSSRQTIQFTGILLATSKWYSQAVWHGWHRREGTGRKQYIGREWEASSLVISITHKVSFHDVSILWRIWSFARQRLGKHLLKGGIAIEVEVHLLRNGSLARVPASTNITKDIPVKRGE